MVDTLVRGRAATAVEGAIRRAVAARLRLALRALGRARSSATLVFTDDDEIRVLNRVYRRHDRATDVLSFHLQELAGEGDPTGAGINLGDIVISVETARRRAAGRRLQSELERLAIHGLCHLFGHDHKRPSEAKVMFALERKLRLLPRPSSAPDRGSAAPAHLARAMGRGQQAPSKKRAQRAIRSASPASRDKRTTSR